MLSNRNITFSGEIEEHVKEVCYEAMDRLLDMAPFDSMLLCHISDRKTEFSGIIRINSSQGPFTTHAINLDPYKLIEELSTNISIQLDHWKKFRFEEHKTTPKRVLIIDDDMESISPLQMALKGEGFEVEYASNGSQAVEKLLNGQFDLMTLDWRMPNINGKEVIQIVHRAISFQPKLKRHWEHPQIPVITYSVDDLSYDDLPPTRHFNFIHNWNKKMRFTDLCENVSQVAKYV